ncbi:MAG: hypothetical protein HQL31_02050 [Planctomycetes bacterium]|nr:hypothetical protein [Planctomycetota bacterium]
MHLELKNLEQNLLEGIRPLIRQSKKEGIHLLAFAEGYHADILHANQAQTGPFSERTWIFLTLHAIREDRYFVHRRRLGMGGVLDAQEMMNYLQRHLDGTSTAIEQRALPELAVKARTHAFVDRKLIETGPEEILSFYQSRFLVDGRQKMLYDASLEKGLAFEGVFRSDAAPVFAGKSYFFVQSEMRGKNFNTYLQISGGTLREMLLASVRPQLAPYRHAKRAQEMLKLPQCVILGPQALAKLADASRTSIRNGSTNFSGWLDPLEKDSGHPFSCLSVTGGDFDHPLSLAIFRAMQMWQQEPGDCEDRFEDILMGKSDLFTEAVYIQNLASVRIWGEDIKAHSYGSCLFLQRGSPPHLINVPLDICVAESSMLRFRKQAAKERTTVTFRQEGYREHFKVPLYMKLDDLLVNFSMDETEA